MSDAALLPLAAALLAVTGMAVAAALRGWDEWLAVKRDALAAGRARGAGAAPDLAALRARVRRLEAIADGAEL
ncbi:MAG: hypothetical protein JOZ90_01375 [Alphaproteobacteria bacterium]|nr:hypothetical protein [Alphaproteobacteria bacterium]MBV9370241.1 hypothetical protein [Alphaproteobacteria bacterium]MBV9899726.1 hypothetical protein [Alphaproteobacteria bacterium]